MNDLRSSKVFTLRPTRDVIDRRLRILGLLADDARRRGDDGAHRRIMTEINRLAEERRQLLDPGVAA